MDNTQPKEPIDIARLQSCANSLTEAVKIANFYSKDNPGITLVQKNLHELKSIIRLFDSK